MNERGGAQFVAVLQAPAFGDRLVGEAGYNVLADGDGEVTITIARGWRDFLGPYLVNAVAQAGAASGVPNLQVTS